MAAMKIGTKLTDNPKDYMLRTRLDKKTLQKLDAAALEKATTRSEIVRIGIEMQYEKMFQSDKK